MTLDQPLDVVQLLHCTGVDWPMVAEDTVGKTAESGREFADDIVFKAAADRVQVLVGRLCGVSVS